MKGDIEKFPVSLGLEIEYKSKLSNIKQYQIDENQK